MKFIFENEDESQMMWNSAHDSILYWKKVRQDAQGKICLQCDGSPTHYSVDEAEENMQNALKTLQMIENTPHYAFDPNSDEVAEYIWVEKEKYPSSIISQSSTIMNRVFA